MQGNPAQRQCAKDNCEKVLRSDNRDGFCRTHKSKTSRAPVRVCADGDCDQELRITNKSGFCHKHVAETPNVKARNEGLRAATRERRAARPQCQVENCENGLRSDNKTGRCGRHAASPADRPKCSIDECEKRLDPRNRIGRCTRHKAKRWVAPECAEGGCKKKINAKNLTGLCGDHTNGYRRDVALRRLYDISEEQYDAMLAEQGGVCAICGKPPKHGGKGAASCLHVEHCHKTGRVRALVCLRCNGGLGAFDDSAELLRKAADYLEHHARLAAEADRLTVGLLF